MEPRLYVNSTFSERFTLQMSSRESVSSEPISDRPHVTLVVIVAVT